MECGIPITLDDPVLHDVSYIVNDEFRDHFCRDLPGNKRKLFDSLVTILRRKNLIYLCVYYIKIIKYNIML